MMFCSAYSLAQNTLPTTGNVGIGTTNPTTRLNRFLNKKSDAANFAGNSASNISPKEFLSIDKKIKLLPLDGDETGGIFGGYQHDLNFYSNGTDGLRSAFFNTNTIVDDINLVKGSLSVPASFGSVSVSISFGSLIILKSSYQYSYWINTIWR